jgi:hypothetical protein
MYYPILAKEETTLADKMRNGLAIKVHAPTGGTSSIDIGYPRSEFYTYDPLKPMKMGLVVGTYASVQYVHLLLESWSRNFSHVSLMVHDDCSDKQEELLKLCQKYGALFTANSGRLGHTVGDTSAMYAGMLWAEKWNIDLLVKFSRRMLPLYDWTEQLKATAIETQYPTFSNICRNLNWGFRSEAMAIHLPTWKRAGTMDVVRDEILWKKEMFAENFWHNMAREVHRYSSPAHIEYVLRHPKEEWRSGYGDFAMIGEDRTKRVDGLIWHHSCTVDEYYAVSAAWGLPYTREDFVLPEGAHD